VRDESSAPNADVAAISSLYRGGKVTQQILSHWQPFLDLKLMFAGSRRAEQSSLRSQQHIVATVEDSVLRTEMTGLESQGEDAPKRILFLKPMSWLGQIRSHRRNEAWSASLWQTFFAMTIKPLAACAFRKFQLDAMGISLLVPLIRVPKRLMTGPLSNWLTFSIPRILPRRNTLLKSRGRHCGDIELAAYLANAAGPVPLVLDRRIAHDRFGSSSDPSLNGHLHYPNDIDKSLNEAAADKIWKYRADHNNNPPSAGNIALTIIKIAISFMPPIASASGRLHSEFIRLLFLQARRETDRFFAV
jgi:hypothetical protein